jgi:hypothetical protein
MASSALLGLLLAVAAPADTGRAERHEDRIHSDVPLWGTESGVLWPRSFSEEDGSFGCATRLRHGDWRLDKTPRDGGEDAEDPTWFRLTNYGVLHCAMVVRQADERELLEGRQHDFSFLVELGEVSTREGTLDLWLLQRGTTPGSSYLLLARKPGGGIIEQFDVLQSKCPRGRTRTGPVLDSWRTSYCAVNTRREMKQLARRMAALPPLGRLAFEAPSEDVEEEAVD